MTLDAVNDALFWGRKIPSRDRTAVATWLASRCGQPDSYEGMPAPTAQDFVAKPRLFTGEPVTSGGGTACKLGNEGCRALILLGVKTRVVADALAQAEVRMTARLDPADGPRGGPSTSSNAPPPISEHPPCGLTDHLLWGTLYWCFECCCKGHPAR